MKRIFNPDLAQTGTHITAARSTPYERAAVEITDESLIGLGILPQDVIIIDIDKPFEDGHVVSVTTSTGLLIRRIYKCTCGTGDFTLISGNPRYVAKCYKQEEINVLGVASHVERKGLFGRFSLALIASLH